MQKAYSISVKLFVLADNLDEAYDGIGETIRNAALPNADGERFILDWGFDNKAWPTELYVAPEDYEEGDFLDIGG